MSWFSSLFGGTKTPEQPSTEESVKAWAKSLPLIYQEQMQYAPLMAQSQYNIQKSLYPQTTALPEQMASVANQGMGENMPDWMKQQYLSDYNANLGSNVGSPIGADYASRGLMQQREDWKRYYQNMGLSVAGMQPLTQSNTNFMQGYTPQAVGSQNAQNYGTYANAFTNLNGQYKDFYSKMFGGAMGGAGSAMAAG
jgi:hypothetical protein